MKLLGIVIIKKKLYAEKVRYSFGKESYGGHIFVKGKRE